MSILNSPIKVGGLTLKNRLVMPPMATPKSEDDGLVTEELCGYYSEKSQDGQLGLVITEHSYVDIAGKAHQGQLSIADDGVIPGLARLTEAIHRNNTPVFAQISHAGGRTNAAITGHEGVAPSAVRLPRSKEGEPLPRAMSREEIVRLAACDFMEGGITQAAAAEELLQQGKADLIGVGRALLKNSTWAKEALRAVEAQ